MKLNRSIQYANKSVLTLILAALALPGLAQQPTAAERAAQLKGIMEASQGFLRQYEWIETTVISVKGEEKSHKQQRCYYGADGGLQKVELSGTPPPEKKRGLRGKIAEKQARGTDRLHEKRPRLGEGLRAAQPGEAPGR